jgi:hypothetical protein
MGIHRRWRIVTAIAAAACMQLLTVVAVAACTGGATWPRPAFFGF